MVVIPEDQYLEQQGVIVHYGTPRHSGRYPYGSGEEGGQRNQTLLGEVDRLKRERGLTDTQAASEVGISTTDLRAMRTLARNERKQDEIHMAKKLKEKGLSGSAIAARMREAGFKVNSESQVRALLKPSQERKAKVLDAVADTLRKAVDEKGYLDVGSGVEFQLNITGTKLRSALKKLRDEGYVVHSNIKVEQFGTGNYTNMRVLTKPGTTWGDAQRNRHSIEQLKEYSDDGGMTSLGMLPPLSVDSKRVGIRYAEEGGGAADGVLYVRDGVPDMSLGKDRYAQVRVMVDRTHYIKGMAIKVSGDQLPDGVDILFNTNKNNTGKKHDALKKITDDPDNPFGATVRQLGERVTDPKTGKVRVTKLTSAMNLVNSEGDWDRWSKSLSSQMLSKQRPVLAKEQLDLTYDKKKAELDTILRLTNPSVRKKLLEAYADSADSSAVHLKAAALPRQKTQVILPVSNMKPNEVFAPGFRDGERVVLIRFPHGGTFEIPELTVNNKNVAARSLLGPDARDAIGIHPKTAERLSGADFDGDNVLVIPNNQGRVRSTSALEGLKSFEPKTLYAPYDGMRTIDGGVYNAKTKSVDYGSKGPSSRGKGLQMGLVSNLITDMTIQRANTDELARAVRHSMVVIDAEKHNLDYRRSEKDNGISALMAKYQKSSQGGASTLISRATSPKKVDERKERSASKGGPIDPSTGRRVYENTGRSRTWTDEHGKTHVHLLKTLTTKLADTDDAHTLSSGTVIEKVYADHSNRLKSLANQARKELVNVKSRPYSSSAKKAYENDVETLNAKLNLALRNAPLERQAQVIANRTVRLKIQNNPNLKEKDNKAELKRLKSQALAAARMRTGADKQKFDITDTEWAAIQAGAITTNKLDQILTYADLDVIKKLATPRVEPKMSSSAASKARSLRARGYTWADIADALGVSVSTLQKELSTTEEGD